MPIYYAYISIIYNIIILFSYFLDIPSLEFHFHFDPRTIRRESNISRSFLGQCITYILWNCLRFSLWAYIWSFFCDPSLYKFYFYKLSSLMQFNAFCPKISLYWGTIETLSYFGFHLFGLLLSFHIFNLSESLHLYTTFSWVLLYDLIWETFFNRGALRH